MRIAEYKYGRMTDRDMTDEEIAAMNAEPAPDPEPTPEERLSDLEDLVSVLTEVICGD